jgi:hypothetical protein
MQRKDCCVALLYMQLAEWRFESLTSNQRCGLLPEIQSQRWQACDSSRAYIEHIPTPDLGIVHGAGCACCTHHLQRLTCMCQLHAQLRASAELTFTARADLSGFVCAQVFKMACAVQSSAVQVAEHQQALEYAHGYQRQRKQGS